MGFSLNGFKPMPREGTMLAQDDMMVSDLMLVEGKP